MCLGMGNMLRMSLGVGNVLRLGMSRLPGLLMTSLRMDDVVPLSMWLRMRHGFWLGNVLCRDRSAAARFRLFHRQRGIVLGSGALAAIQPGCLGMVSRGRCHGVPALGMQGSCSRSR
jgi:hypothetical protein